MRVVIDGLPTTAGSSLAVIVEHFLEGWVELDCGDELHLVLSPDARIKVPDEVHLHSVDLGARPGLKRIVLQNTLVPKLCRSLGADAMLGVLPTTTVAPLPCPRVVIAYDLRHELLPHQFSSKTIALRKVSYGLGWRQADAIASISDRTTADLLASRPWLRERPIRHAPLGSDHVASWAKVPTAEPYAIAFGQYGNKNVDMVIDAWGVLRDRGETMPIRLLGMPDGARATAEAHIARLGLQGQVVPEEWLFGADLERRFASAALVVFPSDFEGFGIPAVEAMRLDIPLVITPEAALLEVTDRKATVMDGWGPVPLADAVERALRSTPEALDAARRRAEEFTWARMASGLRDALGDAIAAHAAAPSARPA